MEHEKLYIEDCPKYHLNDKGMYLQGFSKAGDRTGFMLFPHKLLFDCGVRTKQAPAYIFNTHCHVDHTGELPYICNKHKLFDLPNYQVYTPGSTTQYLMLLVRAIATISNPKKSKLNDTELLLEQKIEFKPVNAGDIFMAGLYEIEVLEAHHDVQSVGYGISSFSKKLKKEYEGLPGKELALLKKSGIDIQEQVKNYDIAFFCDSTIHNLTEHSEWKKYPIIVCECTGFDGRVVIDNGHTGITELLPVMMENQDKSWIIIHTSRSAKNNLIEKLVNEIKSQGINLQVIGHC